MGITHSGPKRRLNPFRKLLAEGHRRTLLSKKVAERMIMEAKAVIIGTDISASERELIMAGFFDAIQMMNDSGGKIVATAVVVE
jgi:hypothetical protein